VAKSSTTWQTGKSGNPGGRRKRLLTAVLDQVGKVPLVDADGKQIDGRLFVAQRLWELVEHGRTTLLDGQEVVVDMANWLDIVKFIYGQVDGPPPREVDVGGQLDGPVVIVINGVDPDEDI